jgi:hypothetical protein
MTHITKHHTKQERESHLGEYCWVDFLVHRDTISVNHHLEGDSKFIDLDVSGWLDGVVLELFEVSGWVLSENFLDSDFFLIRTPEVADIGYLSSLHKVELEVKMLFLGNKPFVHLQSTHLVLAIISSDLVNLSQVILELLLRVIGQAL